VLIVKYFSWKAQRKKGGLGEFGIEGRAILNSAILNSAILNSAILNSAILIPDGAA
jgi:hypothetical protein